MGKPLILGFVAVGAALGLVTAVEASSGRMTLQLFSSFGSGQIRIQSDQGVLTDTGSFGVDVVSGVSRLSANYVLGKGPAIGGSAQATGRNAQGQSICTVIDTTINGAQATNTCPSAPVSILGIVD